MGKSSIVVPPIILRHDSARKRYRKGDDFSEGVAMLPIRGDVSGDCIPLPVENEDLFLSTKTMRVGDDTQKILYTNERANEGEAAKHVHVTSFP